MPVYFSPGSNHTFLTIGDDVADIETIKVEYRFKQTFNPLTWRIFTPRIYVEFIVIESMEHNTLIRVCPHHKLPVAEDQGVLFKQDSCNYKTHQKIIVGWANFDDRRANKQESKYCDNNKNYNFDFTDCVRYDWIYKVITKCWFHSWFFIFLNNLCNSGKMLIRMNSNVIRTNNSYIRNWLRTFGQNGFHRFEQRW